MSMLWAFERLFWRPEAVEQEQRELRAALEDDGDDQSAPPVLTCRLCGYQGAEWFCPRCLADTMDPPPSGPPARVHRRRR